MIAAAYKALEGLNDNDLSEAHKAVSKAFVAVAKVPGNFYELRIPAIAAAILARQGNPSDAPDTVIYCRGSVPWLAFANLAHAAKLFSEAENALEMGAEGDSSLCVDKSFERFSSGQVE